jgi:hypothetical protein
MSDDQTIAEVRGIPWILRFVIPLVAGIMVDPAGYCPR